MKLKRILIVALGLFSTLVCAAARKAGVKRPNIFFFFADDWGHYAGVYPDDPVNATIHTPTIDNFAHNGAIFNNAYVNAPSSTPCRSSLLSGQYFYRTNLGAILYGAHWDSSIPSYPLLLQQSGYDIGYTYKVWGPGSPLNAPYGGDATKFEPAGSRFNSFSIEANKLVKKGMGVDEAKQEIYNEGLTNFRAFLNHRDKDKPFCYWFGPRNTHRKWQRGSGKKLWGRNPDELKGRMPDFLPDVPDVREDFNDYLGEVQALDEMFRQLLLELDKTGERENTIIVVSGDHGIPGFPRAKTNCYPFGTHVSLFIQWPGVVQAGRTIEDFVNLMDLAPTFLEAGSVEIPGVMTGRSIVPLLSSTRSGQIEKARDYVVTGRERHLDDARPGYLPYPMRSIRTKDFLYIWNICPDRYPMGYNNKIDETADQQTIYKKLQNNTRMAFTDVDASPTKAWMFLHRNEPQWKTDWELGFGMRPEVELYDLRNDPHYLHNLAGQKEYSAVQKTLAKRLKKVLTETKDPRMQPGTCKFDLPPYAGSAPVVVH